MSPASRLPRTGIPGTLTGVDATADLPYGAAFDQFAVTAPAAGNVTGSITVTSVLDIEDVNASNPFTKVLFYLYNPDPTAQDAQLIGTASRARRSRSRRSASSPARSRFDTTSLQDGVVYRIFAVGVEGRNSSITGSNGDAIATPTVSVTVDNS